ncbi:hypothetical protein ACFOY8_13020 [Thalassospira xianhensis]|uniref:Uncharacterized protein n=1 Tax=Thalassospira xianhensis MCCC 1A02616 TaxID=1177929 RepID=A0A367UI18_9PROT|nr:hypothetical protein [Thalassospira xianhensis]RCK07858.1 hypothetical protein TH5_02275 [Thalassospira xianhensis MCCC 1A02616]
MQGLHFYRAVDLTNKCAHEMGVDVSDIVAKDFSIVIRGTGVELWWMAKLPGREVAGWQVRHNFVSVDLIEDNQPAPVSKVVDEFVSASVAEAVRCAVLTVLQFKTKDPRAI